VTVGFSRARFDYARSTLTTYPRHQGMATLPARTDALALPARQGLGATGGEARVLNKARFRTREGCGLLGTAGSPPGPE